MRGLSCAATSWKVERRVIARVEAGPQGVDSRFIVTNLRGLPKALYEKLYCARGVLLSGKISAVGQPKCTPGKSKPCGNACITLDKTAKSRTAMPDYILVYARPRRSIDGASIIFETQQAQAECENDDDAIRWALHDIPRDCGTQHDPAVPMALWRSEPGPSRKLVWESEPGMALRAPG